MATPLEQLKGNIFIGLFGKRAGLKLLHWLDPCCTQFCDDVQACVSNIDSFNLPNGAVDALPISFGADENNGFYGISDTQLGIAVEGVLVGGANTTGLFTGNIAEQVAAAGVTVDSVLLKDGGVSNAGATQFATFVPVALPQALSGPGAVNVTSYQTRWTSTATGNALTLANGTQIGQLKKISYIAEGAGGDTGVLTPTTPVGFATATFNAVGDYLVLIWTGAAWAPIDYVGVTLA